MNSTLVNETEKIFSQVFEGKHDHVVQAPGRVNLIGEHTDYNGGFVLPMAVDRGVAIAGRKRNDPRVILYSADFKQKVEFHANSIESDPSSNWANYFKGVSAQLAKNGFPLGGCEAVIKGDLPQGAGLSSSAALEIASAVFLQKLFRFDLADLDLVRLAQKAENEFVGVKCGIMDMFASHLSKEDHALFLDCRSLDHEQVPLGAHLRVVVFNTGVKRELASSAYNERRRECEEGVKILSKVLPGIQALRDVSLCDFEKHQSRLNPLTLKRCRHIISENQRVLDAIEAFKAEDWKRVKVLFRESHESLRDDFEVSCPELDTLVELAQNHDFPLGSRMTGGGFGGCTVHLVPSEAQAREDFISFVSRGYEKRYGRLPETYVFQASNGAKVLNQS